MNSTFQFFPILVFSFAMGLGMVVAKAPLPQYHITNKVKYFGSVNVLNRWRACRANFMLFVFLTSSFIFDTSRLLHF